MANLSKSLQREAVTQGYNLWITSSTGQSPLINRHKDGVDIKWRPGQASKMATSILESMRKPSSPDDLNVSVNFTPVLIPIAIKKGALYLAGYTALTVTLTKLLWK